MEKRKLLNLKPLFKKFLRIGITSFIYVLVILSFYHLFQFVFQITYPAITLFIILSFLLFYHEQISSKIRYLIDKNLYHKIYRINKLVDKFDITLNSTLDFQKIVDHYIQFLGDAFDDHQWAFYYCWGEDYELFASNKIADTLPCT